MTKPKHLLRNATRFKRGDLVRVQYGVIQNSRPMNRLTRDDEPDPIKRSEAYYVQKQNIHNSVGQLAMVLGFNLWYNGAEIKVLSTNAHFLARTEDLTLISTRNDDDEKSEQTKLGRQSKTDARIQAWRNRKK